MGAGAEPAFFLFNDTIPIAVNTRSQQQGRRTETMRKEVEQLWQLAEPPIAGAGLELVELDFNREAEGWVLRVYIDQPWQPDQPAGAASPVSFDECERVSRDLSAALDVADAITHAYRLEVSSPGLERPLRRTRDFQRFAGQKVKVRTVDLVDGRRNFSGTIRGAINDAVEVECDGRCYQIPVSAIARAHLVPDWDAEFRRGGQGPEAPDGSPRKGEEGLSGKPSGNRPHRSAS
jgi:ribosome maturation factor RimP